MKLSSLGALSSIITLIGGAVSQTTADLPTLPDVTGNASALFGWQLAGADPSDTFKSTLCSNTAKYSSRMGQSGINTTSVFDIFCSFPSSSPALATPNFKQYITDIFISQLLNACPYSGIGVRGACYDQVCNHWLNPTALDLLGLDGSCVAEAVCRFSANPTQTSDGNDSDIPVVNLDPIIHNASALFGVESLLIPQTMDELVYNCEHNVTMEPSCTAIGLNPAICLTEMCIGLLTPDQIIWYIQYYSTNIFLYELIHMSSKDFYLQFFCPTLNVAGMDSVGLNGTRVQQEICALVQSDAGKRDADPTQCDPSNPYLTCIVDRYPEAKRDASPTQCDPSNPYLTCIVDRDTEITRDADPAQCDRSSNPYLTCIVTKDTETKRAADVLDARQGNLCGPGPDHFECERSVELIGCSPDDCLYPVDCLATPWCCSFGPKRDNAQRGAGAHTSDARAPQDCPEDPDCFLHPECCGSFTGPERDVAQRADVYLCPPEEAVDCAIHPECCGFEREERSISKLHCARPECGPGCGNYYCSTEKVCGCWNHKY